MTREFFNTCVHTLDFMIRNKHTLHSQSDLRKIIYGDVKKTNSSFNRKQN